MPRYLCKDASVDLWPRGRPIAIQSQDVVGKQRVSGQAPGPAAGGQAEQPHEPARGAGEMGGRAPDDAVAGVGSIRDAQAREREGHRLGRSSLQSRSPYPASRRRQQRLPRCLGGRPAKAETLQGRPESRRGPSAIGASGLGQLQGTYPLGKVVKTRLRRNALQRVVRHSGQPRAPAGAMGQPTPDAFLAQTLTKNFDERGAGLAIDRAEHRRAVRDVDRQTGAGHQDLEGLIPGTRRDSGNGDLLRRGPPRGDQLSRPAQSFDDFGMGIGAYQDTAGGRRRVATGRVRRIDDRGRLRHRRDQGAPNRRDPVDVLEPYRTEQGRRHADPSLAGVGQIWRDQHSWAQTIANTPLNQAKIQEPR